MTAEIIQMFPEEGSVTLTQEQEFDLYVQRLPRGALLCRANQNHRFPDWGTKGSHASRKNGVTLIEAKCSRHCGTQLTQLVDEDGYVTKRRLLTYDEDKGYKLPKEARTGKGLSKAMNARFRQELLIRNADWITEE